jgi:hypothetical protein
MLDRVRLLVDIDDGTYRSLWTNLSGITEAELDWRPNPHANSVRWVLGHCVWYEEWVPDALEGVGRLHSDGSPTAYRLGSLDEIRGRYDAARERCRAVAGALGSDDLERELDYFGNPYTAWQTLVAHTTHLAGSRYQIRYIRGTHSREQGTDKSAFDPW